MDPVENHLDLTGKVACAWVIFHWMRIRYIGKCSFRTASVTSRKGTAATVSGAAPSDNEGLLGLATANRSICLVAPRLLKAADRRPQVQTPFGDWTVSRCCRWDTLLRYLNDNTLSLKHLQSVWNRSLSITQVRVSKLDVRETFFRVEIKILQRT